MMGNEQRTMDNKQWVMLDGSHQLSALKMSQLLWPPVRAVRFDSVWCFFVHKNSNRPPSTTIAIHYTYYSTSGCDKMVMGELMENRKPNEWLNNFSRQQYIIDVNGFECTEESKRNQFVVVFTYTLIIIYIMECKQILIMSRHYWWSIHLAFKSFMTSPIPSHTHKKTNSHCSINVRVFGGKKVWKIGFRRFSIFRWNIFEWGPHFSINFRLFVRCVHAYARETESGEQMCSCILRWCIEFKFRFWWKWRDCMSSQYPHES